MYSLTQICGAHMDRVSGTHAIFSQFGQDKCQRGFWKPKRLVVTLSDDWGRYSHTECKKDMLQGVAPPVAPLKGTKLYEPLF